MRTLTDDAELKDARPELDDERVGDKVVEVVRDTDTDPLGELLPELDLETDTVTLSV